jgi:tetratricopeptide (TPR) repeat protein
MADARQRKPLPNRHLGATLTAAGTSHHALAHRVNQLAADHGLSCHYTHTSVANWQRRGMTPRWPVPRLIAQALSERLGRAVSLAEIGMAHSETVETAVGLDFPRDLASAVRVATDLWSHVDRRHFLSGTSFAISAFTTPVRRWLITSADPAATHRGSRMVGTADIAALSEAADQARHWDSKYGGGDWRTSSLTTCLHRQAAPLLHGTYSDAVGRQLFAATAELSRLAGFTAFDTGQHDLAQRYYIQALRLARAAGDLPLGGYALATMAMQAMLRGYHDEAIDMAQAASERTRGVATHRTTAFFKLIEARAHARAHDQRAAEHSLATADRLLDKAASTGGNDPHWIDFFTHARLAADATEIYRDLHRPDLAHRWNTQARMPADTFTRSVGMRLAIVGTASLQARELDEGLALGHQALDILEHVSSARAKDYLQDLLNQLTPWQHEQSASEFTHRASQLLSA